MNSRWAAEWLATRGRRVAVFLLTLTAGLSIGGLLIARTSAPTPAGPWSTSCRVQFRGTQPAGLTVTEIKRSLGERRLLEQALLKSGVESREIARLDLDRLATKLRVELSPGVPAPEVTIGLPALLGLERSTTVLLVNRLAEGLLTSLTSTEQQAAEAAARQAAAERDAAQARLATAQAALEAGGRPATSSELRDRLEAIVARRARLLEQRTPEHPEVLELDQQLEELQGRLEASDTGSTRSTVAIADAEELEEVRNQARASCEQAVERATRARAAADSPRQLVLFTPATVGALSASSSSNLAGWIVGLVLLSSMLAWNASQLVALDGGRLGNTAAFERALGAPVLAIIDEQEPRAAA